LCEAGGRRGNVYRKKHNTEDNPTGGCKQRRKGGSETTEGTEFDQRLIGGKKKIIGQRKSKKRTASKNHEAKTVGLSQPKGKKRERSGSPPNPTKGKRGSKKKKWLMGGWAVPGEESFREEWHTGKEI